MGGFDYLWKEIEELIPSKVLDTRLARAIVRKAGLVPGQGPSGLPPGGEKGQRLDFTPFSPDSGSFSWVDVEAVAEVLPDINTIDPTLTPVVKLGFAPRAVIRFGSLRNPPNLPNWYGPDDHVARGMRQIGDHRRHQFFEWESIPAGLWYYPLNVDWFVKQVDLSATTRFNVPVEINVQACVVEGSPPADLQVRYSTVSRTGPWTTLASANLSGGGAVRSEWLPLPEGAKADVWLSLFVNARSSVSKLHLAYAEARVRWAYPEDYWQPYYDWIA